MLQITRDGITTREELINALSEAAYIEHATMVQYLFAAYSMKKRSSEGISESQVEKVRDWEGSILVVARQEMAHLANVCNLLTAVGGSPRFDRPNFPQSTTRDDFPFDFQLERFNQTSLQRFITFETPSDVKASMGAAAADAAQREIAPDPLQFDRVGILYQQIEEGFRVLDENYRSRGERLFIGPPEAQDADSWTQPIGRGGFNVVPITDLASAITAIDTVVSEGEGAPSNREGSHYDAFLDIQAEYLKELEEAPEFDPARPVVITPLTRLHRDSGPGEYTLLQENTPAHDTAELFNHLYETVLLMLIQFYDYGGETRTQRMGLQNSIRQFMSAVIRPIAEVLTYLPAGKGIAGNAGPGFEIYGPLKVPSHLPSRWTLLRERFNVGAAECDRLSRSSEPALARLKFITTNLQLLSRNIRTLEEGI